MSLLKTLGSLIESRASRILSTLMACIAMLTYVVPGLSDASATMRRLLVVLAGVLGWVVLRALRERRQSAEKARRDAVVFWDGPGPIDTMTTVTIHYLIRRGTFEPGGQTIDRERLDAMLASQGLTQKDVENMYAAAVTTSGSVH